MTAADEFTNQGDWWWLSFADPNRPEGSQFLGVAIVQAFGLVDAVCEAHRLGINPGGEVRGILTPPEHLPEPGYRNRLLTKTEARKAGRAWTADEFTCHRCGGAFPIDWTDDEAREEAESMWGPFRLADMATVCDDCWHLMGFAP